MKYAVLIGDGMSDWPVEELQERTPLEVAKIPHLNRLAKNGVTGWGITVPKGVAPGSDIANLSIFGYDPLKYYTGRAPLEAASLGVALSEDEVAFRCNLVTVTEGRMKDFTAGHITTELAQDVIQLINSRLGGPEIKFYCGLSYRHLMVIKESVEPQGDKLSAVKTTPPHDITGQAISDKIPSGPGSEILRRLMKESAELLHGQQANMIWLWGQGKAPELPRFYQKYKLTGAVITAVPLIKGVGVFSGLKVIDVPGATGFLDTNYAGKVAAALKALEDVDLVFIHVEAPDETGHMGETKLKIQAIEDFDQKIVGPMIKGMEKFKDFRVMVLPDHPTPLSIMTHASDPVPFVMYGEGKGAFKGTGVSKAYNEKAVKASTLQIKGHDLLTQLING